MAREKKRGLKLPVQQLAILAMVRFAEPLALTSVFPYLPEMIKSFGVPKEQVAKWAGMTSAVFSVAQSLTAVPWGWTSDTIGRKPTIIIGLVCTMVCFLFWGSSTSLAMAITVRGIQGASNGNVGTIRTMVAEMVPQKPLQPRAFSIMPMVWSIGSVFGPSFGGFFARPAEQFPGLFGRFQLFKTFPFLLPNLIACIFFVISALSALLFLEETLETRKHKLDWGIELGERLTRIFHRGKPSKRSLVRARARARAQHRARRLSFADDEASAPLLSSPPDAFESQADLSLRASKPLAAVDESESLDDARVPPLPSSPARSTSIFTYQTSMALLCYTLLALHSVAYDQVLPVFLNYPHEQHDASNTHLPFKFSGGFGLSSGRIGTIFTVNALVSGFGQFVAFPPLCTRFGALRCFRFSASLLPFVYILTPYSTLVPNDRLRYAAFMASFILKGIFSNVTFPCITIILTNSAPSLKVLGTLNGYATLVSGMGRAVGPAATGAVFSWGVQHGYIISGWAFLAVVAIVGAISTYFLQEGDGFEEPTAAGADAEELEEDHFDSESGDLAYSYATTEDGGGDDDDDSYEDALLREIAEDDEDYMNDFSGRPWKATASADSPLPAPTASRFNNTLSDGPVSAVYNLPPSQGRSPRLSKLQTTVVGDLCEPEDPESDPDVANASGLGLGLPLDDSAPPSPVLTRRFRSASIVSRRGREEPGAAMPMSPVVASASNREQDE